MTLSTFGAWLATRSRVGLAAASVAGFLGLVNFARSFAAMLDPTATWHPVQLAGGAIWLAVAWYFAGWRRRG